MNRLVSSLSLVLVAALPTATLPGQSPPLGDDVAIAVTRQACGVAQTPHGVRADGPDYRASWTGAAATFEFVPALGERTERVEPWRFTFASAGRTGAALPTTTEGAAPELAAERRVAIDRGAGVVERYDVGPDGIEQSFVFAARPSGIGDLVVRGTVATTLANADDGTRWTNAHGDGVALGAVTGIDARGATCPGSLRVVDDGRTLELVLPAAFVDTASYPLVLDPLIATSVQTSNPIPGAERDFGVDVSYDATTNSYLVVWQRDFGSSAFDVRAQRVRPDGTPIGAVLPITNVVGAGLRAMLPHVANVHVGDRWLVVWQQEEAPGLDRWDVLCRAVSARDGSMSDTVPVLATQRDERFPVVGGERTENDDDALVALLQDGDVVRTVEVEVDVFGGNPRPVTLTTVHSAPGWVFPRLAISHSGGDDGRFVVAWLQRVAGRSAVRSQLVTADNVLVGAIVEVSNPMNTFTDLVDVAVDGDGERFVVAWSAGTSRFDRQIYRSTLVWRGFLDLTVRQASDLNRPNSTVAPVAVGFTGRKFLVTWAASDGLFGQALDAEGFAQCGPLLLGPGATPAFGRASQPSVGTAWASGTDVGEALIGYTVSEQTAPFRSVAHVQRYLDFRGGPIVNRGGRCGRPLTASVNGRAAVGYRGLEFRLTGAPAGRLVVLNFSAQATPPTLACGTCSILLPDAPGASGAAPWGAPAIGRLDIPCNAGLLAARLHAQWVALTPGTSGCSTLPVELSVSDRLELTFDW